MNFRVLIVDDDEKLRTVLRRSLTYEGYCVVGASNGWEALQECADDPPDLMILDWMMPDMDGIEVCRRVRLESSMPILMLTAKDSVRDRVQGLERGADDYLVKPFALEELLARVKALLRRRSPEPAPIQSFADLTLDLGTRTACRGSRAISLSTTEFELLKLFMENPRHVLTRGIIMDRVWGYDFQGESNVLEVYIGYLRRKLEEGGERRLIKTVRGAGYSLRE